MTINLKVNETSKAKLSGKESNKSEYKHEGDIGRDLYDNLHEEPIKRISGDHISISESSFNHENLENKQEDINFNVSIKRP